MIYIDDEHWEPPDPDGEAFAEARGEQMAEAYEQARASLVHEPAGRVHKGIFYSDGRPMGVDCDHDDGTRPPCGDCFNPATWFTAGWKAACEEHVDWLTRQVMFDEEGTKAHE